MSIADPRTAGDLREACVLAARQVIGERGLEHLSLREVARTLGVSHQAPYRHYPSRDHLLAEVMRRCFAHFAECLDARQRFDDPRRDLVSLGEQYLRYARQHALEYRLMVGTAWPDVAVEQGLAREATQAFDRLRAVLVRLHGDGADAARRVDLDAVYIWSTIHGVAGVMNGQCVNHLGLASRSPTEAIAHAMASMLRGVGLARDAPHAAVEAALGA